MQPLENTIKQIDDWVLKTKGQPDDSDLNDLREILIKFQDQVKQEERERIKENIERIDIFPIAAIDGTVLEFISKEKVLKLLTKSNKNG
jgi:hypothetical protein